MDFDAERFFAQIEVARLFVDDLVPKDCSRSFEDRFGNASCSSHGSFPVVQSF
jgi:hypothetical protein